MLDQKEQVVLSYIVSECDDDYKVIYKDDFEDFFESQLGTKKLRLETILTHLKNLHFVDIKYIDEEKVCICPTQQSKLMFEDELKEKSKNKKIKAEIVILLLAIFVFALIGSFLGTLLCNVILG